MLTSALAIYDSTADKVTFYDFVKDNMLAVFATAGFFGLSIIAIILSLIHICHFWQAVAESVQKKKTRKQLPCIYGAQACMKHMHHTSCLLYTSPGEI